MICAGFRYVKQIAKVKRSQQPNDSNLAVWRSAIQHIQRKGRRGLEPRVVSLIATLCRYAAWSTSSCGVERNYFKAKWAVESRKAWLSDELYNDELKILCDFPKGSSDEVSVVDAARQLWVKMLYGNNKGSYRTRLDKGIKRKQDTEKKSLTGFAKRRRDSVGVMLRNVGVARETDKVIAKMQPGGPKWNAELDDEVFGKLVPWRRSLFSSL